MARSGREQNGNFNNQNQLDFFNFLKHKSVFLFLLPGKEKLNSIFCKNPKGVITPRNLQSGISHQKQL